jgi:hypothetical protein
VIDAKTLYHHALKLCDSYFEKSTGLESDESDNPVHGVDSVLAMFVASQMLGATCFHVLEVHDVDLIHASSVFREAMKRGSDSTAGWLDGLGNFFAVEQPDSMEASAGLALRAMNGAGSNRREALVRILAAARILARSEGLSAPERSSVKQQAELLEARIEAVISDGLPGPMTPGGSA